MVALTHLGMFSRFPKSTLLFGPSVAVWCFGGFFAWVITLLSGGRPMSHQFPFLSSIASYQPISIAPVLSKMFERLVSVSHD